MNEVGMVVSVLAIVVLGALTLALLWDIHRAGR